MKEPNTNSEPCPTAAQAEPETPRRASETAEAAPTGPWQRPLPEVTFSEAPTAPYTDAGAVHFIPARGSIGRYQLLGEAKAGGMGVVYKARDTALDRVVALKTLKTGDTAGWAEIARFQREARAVARLKHPHIVPIHDVAQEQGLHYLTMEFVSGGSLAQHLDRYANDPRAAAVLVEKVARAVHYAHERNILHRDLKPANILLDEAGEPRVSDFGLAKILDAQPHGHEQHGAEPNGAMSPAAEPGLHTIGAVGTPAYMSPEQVTGSDVTRSADVWALGVILYQLLSGRPPFLGQTRQELSDQIVDAAPRPLGQVRPGIDQALQAICLKCLEKDPARRYPSAEALANDLALWLRGGPLLRRPWRFVRRRPLLATVLALLLAAVVTAGIVAVWPEDPDRAVHAIQRELAQGKAVTLIGPTGSPPWSRWVSGEAGASIVPTEDQTFTLQTQRIALLELLPDPQVPAFRFSAEIMQRYQAGGSAGLYFGRSRVDTGKTILDWIPYWIFTDHQKNEPKPTHVTCHIRCLEVKPFLEYGLNSVIEVHNVRAGPTLTKWCALALEVTPAEVRLFWQGQEVGRLTREQIHESLQDLRVSNRDLLQSSGFTPDFPDPPFPARAGLGFFVEVCTASFRNVTIEPLAGD